MLEELIETLQAETGGVEDWTAKQYKELCDAIAFAQETLGPEAEESESIQVGVSLKTRYEERRRMTEASTGKMDEQPVTLPLAKSTGIQTPPPPVDMNQACDAESAIWSGCRTSENDLTFGSEKIITEQLKERFHAHKIYTSIVPTLVSINPYQHLKRLNLSSSIYDEDMIHLYRSTNDRKLAPHPFLLAKQSFERVVEHQQDQSIILLGEAGSGKTELAKQIVKYIATVAGAERAAKIRLYTTSTKKSSTMRSDEARTIALLEAKR